jgi:hypothetical protein
VRPTLACPRESCSSVYGVTRRRRLALPAAARKAASIEAFARAASVARRMHEGASWEGAMSDTGRRGAPNRGLRALAILTALTFGCATVRVPASGISDPIPVRDGVAEPQLALYVEGSKAIDPVESHRLAEAAHAALSAAVKEHSRVDGDTLLVVRAQGVTRTPGRRTDQKLAVAGLVVGAVVVVAAAVVAIVASRGKGVGAAKPAARPAASSSGASASRPAAAPRPASHAVRPASYAIRPASSPRPAAPPRAPGGTAPGPRPAPPPAPVPVRPSIARGGGSYVVGPDVSIGFWIDGYGAPAPAPLAPDWTPAPEPAPAEPPPYTWEIAPEPGPDAPPVEAVSLAAPKPLMPEARGFFAGDELVLELVLVDRRDGTPLWTKVVQTDVDPTDAGAVRRVVREALATGSWMPATDLAPAAR